jgi:Cytochrome P450
VFIDQARKTPNGPADAFDREQDLLVWIEANFKKYGDLYRATVFGRNVYVASSPEYAQHVLRNNWENYRKGQAIKRVAILLGNGLMVSEGDFWRNQRRMIQPAFHRNAVAGLYEVMKVAEDYPRVAPSFNILHDEPAELAFCASVRGYAASRGRAHGATAPRQIRGRGHSRPLDDCSRRPYGKGAQPPCCRFRRAREIALAKSLLAPRCKCTL